MKARSTMRVLIKSAMVWSLSCVSVMAQLMSVQERTVINAELVRVRNSLDAFGDTPGKIRFLQNALAQATNSHLRDGILEIAEAVGGDDLEILLIGVVENDPEVDMRMSAVKSLAKRGTARSIQPLLNCARNDPAGNSWTGCIVSHTNVRRNAFFALAELGLRLPAERERIAKAVQEMPVIPDSDTRTTVLYILTGEESLLRPYYERLTSPDPKMRASGVVAFRSLKLKHAPKEVVQLIHDPESDVRQWVALVLGEIGDSETVLVLMTAAVNKDVDRGTRCNAIGSLGKMRAAEAKTLLGDLLSDDDVKINAAIALSQITGERHPLVPQGYTLD